MLSLSLSLSFSFSSPNLSGTACRQKEAKANIRNDACGKRRSESAESWGVVLGRYRLQRIANWLFSAIFRQINRFLFRNWFFILLDSYSMNHDTWFAIFGNRPSTRWEWGTKKEKEGRGENTERHLHLQWMPLPRRTMSCEIFGWEARYISRGSTANRKLYESRCPNSYEMVRCEAIRAPNLNLVFSQQPSHLVPSASPQSSSAKECCASKSVRTSRVIRWEASVLMEW